MKKTEIKKIFKKIFTSILLVFILFINLAPTAHAFNMHGFDNRFYEIPSDSRRLQDFVFTNMDFVYKDIYDKSKDFARPVEISGRLWYYQAYADFSGVEFENGNNTNLQIAPFFIVVDPQQYKSGGQFGIPVNNNFYFYMEYDQDENTNVCLYLDFENRGKWRKKLENTCVANLAETKPFILFMQIGRYGWDKGNKESASFSDSSRIALQMDSYYIWYTTSHLATYENKQYVNFSSPRVIAVTYEELLKVPNISYFNSPIYHSFLFNNRQIYQSLSSHAFRRIGNQTALRPYSFVFREYYTKYMEENCDGTLHKDPEKIPKNCHTTLNVNDKSFFDYFVYNVAMQYYQKPAVERNHEYYDAPDPYRVPGDMQELDKCDSFLDIGCHVSNVGKTISNGFTYVVGGITSGIKGVFSWAWEGVKGFFEPIVKPIWEEIQNIYKEIEDFFRSVFEIITNLFKPGNDPTTQTPSATQKLLCDTDAILQNKENTEQNEGIFGVVFNTLKAGFGIFGIIDPIAPVHGSQLCTYEGIKTLKLRENSFIDIILFLIFGSSLFLLFYRKS